MSQPAQLLAQRPALLKATLLTLLLAFSCETALACIYGPPYKTVCVAYAEADSVISGKIESVARGDQTQTVVIRVKKTFKGPRRQKIVLAQPQSTCDMDFTSETGETMLLYLVRDEQTKAYQAMKEGVNGSVAAQSEDFAWLNNLPASLNRTRLSGTVKLYRDEPF